MLFLGKELFILQCLMSKVKDQEIFIIIAKVLHFQKFFINKYLLNIFCLLSIRHWLKQWKNFWCLHTPCKSWNASFLEKPYKNISELAGAKVLPLGSSMSWCSCPYYNVTDPRWSLQNAFSCAKVQQGCIIALTLSLFCGFLWKP